MPFNPIYTITEKILEHISQITAGRELIEHSPIIPKWELSLRKEARIHNAHSSTSIEGNRLSLEQVKALSEKQDITATAKDKQEVLNYLEALDKIPQYTKNKKMTADVIIDMQRIITRKTLRDEKDCGRFRTRQVFVGRRIFDGTGFKEVIEYLPPDTKDVQRLVKEFFAWLNLPRALKINPVILAGISHYEVARIHPFIDGNGRTARLLASLILYKRDFDHRRFFALDDYYDSDRQAYYNALKTAQNENNDITQWLEYFTEGVLYSVNTVKETIKRIGILHKKENLERVELTKRQLQIIEKIRKEGKITNKQMQKLFGISRQAVLKEISKLIAAEIIVLVGRGKGAHYKIFD